MTTNGRTVQKLAPGVRFMGVRWQIAFRKMKDKLGLWEPTYTRISLNPDQSVDSMRHILSHEMTHGISDTMDLKLTEKQVDGVAAGWLGVLRDNPSIVRFLTD